MKSRISKLMEPVRGRRGIVLLVVMLLVALTAQSLVACSDGTEKATKTGNKIYATELSQEQMDVLHMAGNNNDINIFSYNINSDFKTLIVTRELYKDGELLSDSSFTSGINEGNGMVSIALDSTTGSLVLSHKNGGGTSSSYSMLEDEVLNSGDASGKMCLQDETEIKENEDIILMVTVYGDADGLILYSPEYYRDNPDSFKEYNYVHIVRCRFTSQSGDELNGNSGESPADSD